MVCDRRILHEVGGWRISRERGDPGGDVHGGCKPTRNRGATKESRNTILWNLRPVLLGVGVEKTHGKLYPVGEVATCIATVLCQPGAVGGGEGGHMRVHVNF